MVMTPVTRRPARRRRSRAPVVIAGIVALTCAALAGAALLAWPGARLAEDADALARVDQPAFTGHVERVVVRDASGRRIPVRLENGKIEPGVLVPAGEPLTVEATVRRPSWAAWLVGRTAQQTLTLHAPSAELRGRWLEVRRGAALTLAFDRPVRLVDVRTGDTHRTFRFASARTGVRVGVPGAHLPAAGALTVRAAPRTWERLSAPVQVHWFPRRAHVQASFAGAGRDGGSGKPDHDHVLAPDRHGHRRDPADSQPGGPRALAPRRLAHARICAVRARLPARRARRRDLAPRGRARRPRGRACDAHAALGTPDGVDPAAGAAPRRGGLPPGRVVAQRGSRRAHAAGAARRGDRPARGPVPLAVPDATPKELRGLWRTGHWNEIVRGAVMMFEHDHGLEVDAFVGPQVWHALLVDAIAGKRRTDGYSYVYVHRATPQSLTLWHEGKVIVRSPGNTGVPAAPTQLGTFPVFEHIPVGTMSGTNPDGTRYHDPGIRWISYFNHGDAHPRLPSRELRHAAEPRVRGAAARGRREGVALHADRNPRHDRELRRPPSSLGGRPQDSLKTPRRARTGSPCRAP